MKTLGIDYGEKRMGLAISDESQTFARELGIFSPKEFWRAIKKLIREHQVSAIVLGLPLAMSGADSQKTQEVRAFKERLAEFIGLPVHFMDERFTSQMAEHLPGGKKNTDSLAAQIILQNYLDKSNTIRINR